MDATAEFISENPDITENNFEYSLSDLPPVEYGVDGFTSTGITVIAGMLGLGKSSAIVPLAAEVAHLTGSSGGRFGLHPTLRRKVVYVTEDPGQINRILFGVKRHQSDQPESEFKEWFVIKASRRIPPEALALKISGWRSKYGYQSGPEFNGYRVEPLIIIDTSNANIDLENENDNAQVGKAIAAIKEALGNGMCWLIAHIAKSLGRSEAIDLSVRGAGAWGADANATAFLVSDENLPEKRFLILGKRRFEADYTEIEITSEVHSIRVEAAWGTVQNQHYRVCHLLGLAANNGVKQQVGKAKYQRFEKAFIDVLEEAYRNRPQTNVWLGMNATKLTESVKGNKQAKLESLREMAAKGILESTTYGEHKNATTMYWMKGQIYTGRSE